MSSPARVAPAPQTKKRVTSHVTPVTTGPPTAAARKRKRRPKSLFVDSVKKASLIATLWSKFTGDKSYVNDGVSQEVVEQTTVRAVIAHSLATRSRPSTPPVGARCLGPVRGAGREPRQ